jgi:hypothetical protein
MGWQTLLECPDCRLVWRQTKTNRREKNEDCPRCAARPTEALAAPGLNRGAVEDTRIKIPENKTKRIDFAQRIVAEDHNVTNLRTGTKPGDIVAMPVRTDAGEGKWGAGAGDAALKRQAINIGTAMAAGRTDPYHGRNSAMIDRMADRKQSRMQPVERRK